MAGRQSVIPQDPAPLGSSVLYAVGVLGGDNFGVPETVTVKQAPRSGQRELTAFDVGSNANSDKRRLLERNFGVRLEAGPPAWSELHVDRLKSSLRGPLELFDG